MESDGFRNMINNHALIDADQNAQQWGGTSNQHATAFYLLESGDLCQEAPARGVLGSLFHKPQPVCRRAGT